MKTCSKCKLEKILDEFGNNKNNKDGLQSRCKQCMRENMKRWRSNPKNTERNRENCKRWYSDPKNKQHHRENKKRYNSNPENKKRNSESTKRWRNDPENKQRHRDNYKRWYSEPQNKERQRKNQRRWRADPQNKKRVRENQKERRRTDPLFKLRQYLSSRLCRAIKRKSWHKNSHTKDILGCTLPELLQHLGPIPTYDYHIDHICPCSQAQTEEEVYKLFHYSNLRYIPATDNMSKNDGWTEEGERLCIALLGRGWIR